MVVVVVVLVLVFVLVLVLVLVVVLQVPLCGQTHRLDLKKVAQPRLLSLFLDGPPAQAMSMWSLLALWEKTHRAGHRSQGGCPWSRK